MAKVRTLSRTFLKGHPKEGQSTFFVEKFLNALGIDYLEDTYSDMLHRLNPNRTTLELHNFLASLYPFCEDLKFHTIRGGKHFVAGDFLSPRVWIDQPYHSKQIIIAPDTEVKKVWNVDIMMSLGCIYIGQKTSKNTHELFSFGEVAKNDGLSFEDMQWWFNPKEGKDLECQIICWNENIEY